MRTTMLLACAVLGVCQHAVGADRPGLSLGATVPAFSAVDQEGRTRTLASIHRQNGTVLIFIRSADWCPFSKDQLVEFERQRENFRRHGLGLAAISYDTPAILRDFAERAEIRFPLLADPHSDIIRAFGLLDPHGEPGTVLAGVAAPGILVVDAHGRVIDKYFEDDNKHRLTGASLLVRRYGMKPLGKAVQFANDQVTATLSASTDSVQPGQRITLVLDLRAARGSTIAEPVWELVRQPGFAETGERTAAASGAVQPVESARLLRDVTIGQEPAVTPLLALAAGGKYRCSACGGTVGDLTIQGVLRYRICDRNGCAAPATMRLPYKVHYEPSDRRRVPMELQAAFLGRNSKPAVTDK